MTALAILFAGLFGAIPAVASLSLECPCEVESDGTTFTITAGVKSYRSTNSGPLHLGVIVYDDPDRLAYELGQVQIMESLAPGGLLARASYELPVNADRFSSGDYMIGIRLYEDQSGSLRWADTLRMELRVPPAGVFEVGELDYLKDSDGDGVADPNERLEGTDPDDATSTPDAATIDVLTFYTEEYADIYDGDPTTRIQHLFTLSNQILANSEVSMRLRLVGVTEEQVDPELHNTRYFRYMQDQEASRHGADLIVWFRTGGGGACGDAPIGAHGDRGHFEFEHERTYFANIYGSCGARTLAHELGHLMGLGHAYWQNSTGTWRWSRGHAVDYDFGTIMTYGPQNGGTRLEVFSSPLTQCVGLLDQRRPCGVDRAQIDGADSVASLNAVQFQIARFRDALPDSDADGFVDPVDDLPNDAGEWRDFDGDGVGNNSDADDDDDGVLDGADAFPFDGSESVDTDDDGVGDNADAFPMDPGETADSDGDGVGDNADALPGDPTETLDTDGDGVGDNADLWPENPAESGDVDGDGIGNNADRDADNDGVTDEFDPYPLDAEKTDLVSYLFTGELPGDEVGRVLASGRTGDRQVVVIGAPQHAADGKRHAGAVYLIASDDIALLDSADGKQDRVVDLGHATAGANSWKLVGENAFDQAGYSVVYSGDLNGDDIADLLVGAPFGPFNGIAYLVSGASLAATDAADGASDRTIQLGSVAAQSGSWKFIGENSREFAGTSVAAVPDTDGDGLPEILIGVRGHDPVDRSDAGAAYFLSSGDLQAADLADGVEDGVIDLGNVSGQSASWKLVGEDEGDSAGSLVASAGDHDGDGNVDIVVTAPIRTAEGSRYRGAAYLVSVADLAAADSADGAADHVIALNMIASQANSWKLINGDYLGWANGPSSTAAKLDSTSRWLLLGNHLISSEDLPAADAADGDTDGTVDLLNLIPQPNSWLLDVSSRSLFVGDVDGDGSEDVFAGWQGGYLFDVTGLLQTDLSRRNADSYIEPNELERQSETRKISGITIVGAAAAGDVDGDELADILIGGSNTSNDGERRGLVYLVQAADLVIIDGADGAADGRVNLGNFVGDTDGDGISDLLDNDDDGDSYPDVVDTFQLDPKEWADSDFDGVGDNADAFPNNRREWLDTDGDGLGDFYEDDDDDADGIADSADQYPLDTDNDGMDNDVDTDDDNDGVLDADDALPLDSGESLDTDGDGIGNTADTDDDGDGVADADDALPLDARDSVDTDGDGIGDTTDTFPNDPAETADFDGDGIGDNADTDDDNDGVPDVDDDYPFDASAAMDTDGDGVPDSLDRYPTNPREWENTDGAGFGDNRDTDDDNDGVPDVDDLYPRDRTRSHLISTRLHLPAEVERWRPTVGAAGDIDGDGRQEMLVSGPEAKGGGFAYVVSFHDLVGADRADGVHDGSIQPSNVATQPGSWKLVGDGTLAPGDFLSSLGDIDGDGRSEFRVGARTSLTAVSYMISGADLHAADAADSSSDGVVNLAYVSSQPASWRLSAFWGGFSPRIPFPSDMDGDGSAELAVGQFGSRSGDSAGTVHVFSASDLLTNDSDDVRARGSVSLQSLADDELWRLVGEAANDEAGWALAMTDFNGDGLADFAVGAPRYDANQGAEGAVYLVGSTDLAMADLADGREDKQVNLGRVAAAPNSWKIVGNYVGSLFGSAIAAGDLDGDGRSDLVMESSSPGYRPIVTILSGAAGNLAALDAIDGTSDGTIVLNNVASGVNRRLSGALIPSFRSKALLDFDGDGMDDLVLGIASGISRKSKVAHLISSSSLFGTPNVFAQDDLTLDEQFSRSGSYQIHAPEAITTNAHAAVASAGDLDADGRDDLYLAVFPFASSQAPRPPGAAYVIMASELPFLDAADGHRDNKIFLSHLVRERH